MHRNVAHSHRPHKLNSVTQGRLLVRHGSTIAFSQNSGKIAPMLRGELVLFPLACPSPLSDRASAGRRSYPASLGGSCVARKPKYGRDQGRAPLQDLELFVAAHKVADLVHSYQDAGPGQHPWMEDWRNQVPNSQQRQTAAGLMLEMYYSLPNRLWTPWGTWHFGGSGGGSWDQATPIILERLGATEHEAGQQTDFGYIGPVYAL